MITILNEELEEIGASAFHWCESLHEIVIPNAIKMIKKGAFFHCSGLTAVTLCDGLKEIGAYAHDAHC